MELHVVVVFVIALLSTHSEGLFKFQLRYEVMFIRVRVTFAHSTTRDDFVVFHFVD